MRVRVRLTIRVRGGVRVGRRVWVRVRISVRVRARFRVRVRIKVRVSVRVRVRARPLRHNKANLSPSPTAEERSLHLVTGRPGEPVRPTTPLLPPAMVRWWRVGFFWRELWRDTRADRWLRHGRALVWSARGKIGRAHV